MIVTKKVTLLKWTLVAIIFSIIGNSSIAANETNSPAKTIIKEKPIVISTVAQHYENPTLGQYQLCTKARDECIEKCNTTDKTCRAACPICPVLIDQDILVQGINDTLYSIPTGLAKINQTNIIRLTNEIRNIIETSLGNITASNQNNINIYQNKTSRTGGKFGLGYSEKGPCCHLIEPQKCKRSITGPNCSHKRYRTCGAHCISRVVRSKPVVTCSETNPDECSQQIEYVAQPRRSGCQYTSTWPFINCKRNGGIRRNNCQQCYKIPYMYVMRGQVPRGCLACFGRSSQRIAHRRPIYQPPPVYYGGYQQYPMYQPAQPFYNPAPPSYDYNFGNSWGMEEDIGGEDEFEMPTSDSDWKVEERKCLNEDGTIADKCPEGVDEMPNSLPTEENIDDYDNADDLDYYSDNDMNINQRVRRHRRQHNQKMH